MVIAVPYDELTGEIGQHFGKAEKFKLYEIDEYGMLLEEAVVTPYGTGHNAMAAFLKDYNTKVVLCRHMGEEAFNLLMNYGIMVYMGLTGSADEALKLLIKNAIEQSMQSECGGCHSDCGSGACGSGCGGCCS